MWSAAAFPLAKLGEKKTELLCHPALPQRSSSSNRQNSSHHALHRNFSLPFSPSSSWHNYIPFFLARGLCFLSSRTAAVRLNLDASTTWWNVLAFRCSLDNPNFHTPAWQIFLLPKKMQSVLKLSQGCAKELPGGLSTCLYCNWSLSQVVWKCVENTICSHSFYSFVIAKGELSLCQTHLNIFILLSIYVYSCILTSTFSERWGRQAKGLSIKIQCFMAKNSKTLCGW